MADAASEAANVVVLSASRLGMRGPSSGEVTVSGL